MSHIFTVARGTFYTISLSRLMAVKMAKTWILAFGFWNDGGFWNDDSSWND